MSSSTKKITPAALAWLSATPSELADSFYISENSTSEPLRISSTSFTVTQEFWKALHDNYNTAKKAAGSSMVIKLHMGLDSNKKFSPYISIWGKASSWTQLKPGSHDTAFQFFEPSGNPISGVSPTYKNEVCASWLKLPYHMVTDSLYSTGDISKGKDKAAEKPQKIGPKRVIEFIIPNFDINVLMNVINEKKKNDDKVVFINVYYGYSEGNINFKGIGFTPVFEIGLKAKASGTSDNVSMPQLSDEDDGGTLFDFVHANPPYDN